MWEWELRMVSKKGGSNLVLFLKDSRIISTENLRRRKKQGRVASSFTWLHSYVIFIGWIAASNKLV